MALAKKTAGKTAKASAAKQSVVATAQGILTNATLIVGAILSVYSAALVALATVRKALGLKEGDPIPVWGELSDWFVIHPDATTTFDAILLAFVREYDKAYITGDVAPKYVEKAKVDRQRLALIGVPTAEAYFRRDSQERSKLVEGRPEAVKAAEELRTKVLPKYCSAKWNAVVTAEERAAESASRPVKTVEELLRGCKVERLAVTVARLMTEKKGDSIPKEVFAIAKTLRTLGWVAVKAKKA